MVGTFKANNPLNNFLLFVYAVALKFYILIDPVVPTIQGLDGVLYRTFLNWLQPAGNHYPVIYSMIAIALLFVQAISLNKLISEQRLFPKLHYLPAMSYLLITSVFSEWNVLSSALIINTLLIWVLSRLCNLYNNPHAKTTLFNIGMATGLATLFYFPSIAFSILIIAGLTITRPFKLPEWLIALVGMITPYYFLGAWFFLADHWDKFRLPGIAFSLPRFYETALAYTGIILVLVLISIGMLFTRNNMRRLIVHSRKSWNLIYLYFFVSLFVPFLNAGGTFDYWILTAVPASAFIGAAFFFPQRKWFAIVFHWSLVALTIAMNYFIR